jgi:hypothetical protein
MSESCSLPPEPEGWVRAGRRGLGTPPTDIRIGYACTG